MRDKARSRVGRKHSASSANGHFVFLSATIPNAREFAQWVSKIHQHPPRCVHGLSPNTLAAYMFPMGGDGVHLIVDEKGKFRDDNCEGHA